ncbi:thioredoxin domain-containing protein 16 isoform X2 [Pelobates fuscus]|uniref:thioredoxin domain-containing protein 16 isoform X2 n=1 Tax=Pelobates fuscus TaxID=191477 RepID=UPI002FE4BEC1
MSLLIFLLLFVHIFSLILAKCRLLELTSNNYISTLHPGKICLLYFTKSDTSFFKELGDSVDTLHDYGISVAKVNCVNEDSLYYCTKEIACLFRGTKLLREFPTDTLFDVNAIVANVLFVLLYNEMKYITSTSEFQDIESNMKGKKNMVFVYVRAIGIPEHRAVMEAAFVYGSLYQFVLTTETSLLENISRGRSDLVPAKLIYCHCKAVTSPTHECQRSSSDQPLSTLNIHRFLKLMNAPLVAEVSGDPDKFTSVHIQLGLPLVFIVCEKETYDADRETAEHVAWQLLGKAGVATLSRDTSDPYIPGNVNVGVKTAEEDAPIRYLLLGESQEIIDLIKNTKHQKNEESAEKPIHGDQETQDDEVAEAVYRDRKRVLPLHLVPSLTAETFRMMVTSKPHSMVLFYASWETVSLTFLQSVLQMAEKYKDALDVSLGRVNCADMNDLCNEQNITDIPIAKIYQSGNDPLLYTGMMCADELARFIMLSKLDLPLRLPTMEDAENYLSAVFHKNNLPYHSFSALGIFTSHTEEAVDALTEAGKSLTGFINVAIYCGDRAAALSDKFGVSPPAILFTRSDDKTTYGVSLQTLTAEEIVHLIKYQSLGVFPEITVESFPSFFTPKKPLLLLFSDGRIGHRDGKSISSLVRGRYLESYRTGWINLNNTPVGYGVLKRYFGFIPQLPVLVLIQFDARSPVFALPSDQHLTEVNILYWLEMIKGGAELPIYSLLKNEWKAPLRDYDFLAIMDGTVPDFAAQKIPIKMKSQKVPTEGREVRRPLASLRGTGPRFPANDKEPRTHPEL